MGFSPLMNITFGISSSHEQLIGAGSTAVAEPTASVVPPIDLVPLSAVQPGQLQAPPGAKRQQLVSAQWALDRLDQRLLPLDSKFRCSQWQLSFGMSAPSRMLDSHQPGAMCHFADSEHLQWLGLGAASPFTLWTPASG